MNTTENLFLTTTLPYINSNFHIGHALEFVHADAAARFLRKSYNVRFNVGVDEHGLKIWEKSKELKIDTQIYCDEQSIKCKEILEKLNINYDIFYRTTSKEHKIKVSKFWNECLNRGDIYKKLYEGLYCVGCESFKLEKDLINGLCPDHNKKPDIIKEDNWFFRLSKYKISLLKWISENPEFLQDNRRQELINLIENSDDISISRLKSSVPWGIEVPNDPDSVIYCWFEALLNYIFAASYDAKGLDNYWNTTIQLCGKDNLKFQGCIFQAFLESAGIKHTTKLLVHGTVLDKNGNKMSKSIGNVVDPIEQINKYGLAAVRYYILAGLNNYTDCSWSEEDLVSIYNNDLANNFGNLLSRTLHLIDIFNVEFKDNSTIIKFESDIVKDHFDNFRFKQAAESIRSSLSSANKLINDVKPWDKSIDIKLRNDVLFSIYNILTESIEYYSYFFPKEAEEAGIALHARKKIILFPKKSLVS